MHQISRPKEDRDRLTQMFLRGALAELCQIDVKVFRRLGRLEILVGALAVSGQIERAEALGVPALADDRSGAIAFHLIVSWTRAGRYAEAEVLLKKLLARATAKKDNGKTAENDSPIHFYAEQASGFFQYFRGEVDGTVERARLALRYAESCDDALAPLCRVLSLDLLGHSLIRLDHIKEGMRTLRLAHNEAQNLRHQGFEQAIAISILKYDSLYGLNRLRIVQRLERALRELSPQDSYSRSEILLELARQAILQADFQSARIRLEASSEDILGSRNRGQTASLHILMAWLARLESRPMDALFALKSADSVLDPTVDIDLKTKIELFRASVFADLDRTEEAAECISQVINQRGGRRLYGIDRHIALRTLQPLFPDLVLVTGVRLSGDWANEDPMSQLMDSVVARAPRDEEFNLSLLTAGYFGLLWQRLKLNPSIKTLVVDLPQGGVLLNDEWGVRYLTKGLKGVLGRLLKLLSEKPLSRAEAIKRIWGYEYAPDRHDRLLNMTLFRIRKILNRKASQKLILLSQNRIALSSTLAVRRWNELHGNEGEQLHVEGENARIHAMKRAGPEGTEKLNYRQLQVLRDLARSGVVGVDDVAHRFQVSRASALRDLNRLLEEKWVERLGATRATCYVPTEKLLRSQFIAHEHGVSR